MSDKKVTPVVSTLVAIVCGITTYWLLGFFPPFKQKLTPETPLVKTNTPGLIVGRLSEYDFLLADTNNWKVVTDGKRFAPMFPSGGISVQRYDTKEEAWKAVCEMVESKCHENAARWTEVK